MNDLRRKCYFKITKFSHNSLNCVHNLWGFRCLLVHQFFSQIHYLVLRAKTFPLAHTYLDKTFFMRTFFYAFLLLSPIVAFAGPSTISPHIHIDQFGYRPDAQKVCVISDPQTGFNAAESFSPGSSYQVRRWSDDVSVFNANISAWNSGATHSQSGDKVWWFDFSSFTMPGEYYIYDPANEVGSNRFYIGEDVYNIALKKAIHMFYYQRCGVAKTAAHAGDWDDTACHSHALQDLNCRSVSEPNNAATEKNLSGGWHDAGDFNKYVNFTWSPVHDLLFAYQENPMVFDDNTNLPESGNGIPDLLDELKFELDWLLKMQLSDGSVLMKVAVSCFEAASPASADVAQRMYGPAQISATIAVASMFAHASVVYGALGNAAMDTYAANLLSKAELAWDWLEAHPGTSSYNNAGFCSANPEWSADDQNEGRTGAAAMLFAATGDTNYRSYFDSHYTSIRPYNWGYWYAFQPTIQDIMLYYASLPNATLTVANNIKNNCINSVNSNNPDLLTAWLNNTDAYRAYLKDNDYVWGSNRWKANMANIFNNMVVYGLSPANAAHYANAGESYVHFLHGVNPINKTMLTNMGDFGAENSCDEMYHAWFGDGTNYDNAQTSLYGPPPGYVTGGFNPNFNPDPACGCTISPPQGQPHQKAYKDWNTSWPENSWELTEPAIYSQAAYIKLLSKFAIEDALLATELLGFTATLQSNNTVKLHFSTASLEGVKEWEIQRGKSLGTFDSIGRVRPETSAGGLGHFQFTDTHPNIGINYYRLKMKDLDGHYTYSNIEQVEVKPTFTMLAVPNPAIDFLGIHFQVNRPGPPIDVSLFDSFGMLVFEKTIQPNGGIILENIPVKNLPAGLYLLRARAGAEMLVGKVVIAP